MEESPLSVDAVAAAGLEPLKRARAHGLYFDLELENLVPKMYTLLEGQGSPIITDARGLSKIIRSLLAISAGGEAGRKTERTADDR